MVKIKNLKLTPIGPSSYMFIVPKHFISHGDINPEEEYDITFRKSEKKEEIKESGEDELDENSR